MKYVPSALIGQLSRSAGSTTASHNRFGSYFRNRVIPSNPRSVQQQLIRATFGFWSQFWRTLTQAQRDAWTALGLTQTRTDTLGQTYTLTGLQSFMSSNQNSWIVSGGNLPPSSSFVDNAPLLTPIALTTIGAITMDASAGTVSMAGTLGDMTSFEQVQMSSPVSAGKLQIPESGYRDIAVLDNSSVTLPFAAGAAYTAVWGAFTSKAGGKVFWRYRSIDSISGLSTSWVYGSSIIVP